MVTLKTRTPHPLDKEIERLQAQMAKTDLATEEYDKLLKTTERLYELRGKNKPKSWWTRDAVISAGANLLGIVVIVAYEQKHVITTKALMHLRPK